MFQRNVRPFLAVKGEAKKVNNKHITYNLNFFAHHGSGLDTYLVLNNFPQWLTVTNLTKNCAGILSLNKFNGYVDKNKKFTGMFILNVVEFILRNF